MKKYYSQIGQDQYYIENVSKGKRNGIFLDIGANDGIFESNTAALEFDYGWSGLCIEANPNLINKLKSSRPNAKIINCATWSSDGELELEISDSNYKGVKGDLLSRVTKLERNQDYFKHHFKESRKVINVNARTITNIIKEYYTLPCVIDYMSLDVEGAELEVLKGLDFTNIDIKFMTIEHGNRPGYIEEFAKYLAPYGYKLHRINQWDVEFIL
jgi:FkbM family methyltransferase